MSMSAFKTNFGSFHHSFRMLRIIGQSSSSLVSLAANNQRTNHSLQSIKIAQPIPSSKPSLPFSITGHVQMLKFHGNNSSILAMANKQTSTTTTNNNNKNDKKTDPKQSASNKKTQKDQKDQFIHDHLNSSQDFNQNLEDHIPFEHELVKEPPRERFGVLKAIMIIIAGIYFGSYVAMVGAKLLEDLDIFVKERDDDDD